MTNRDLPVDNFQCRLAAVEASADAEVKRVNDELRRFVRSYMVERKLSGYDMARLLGVDRPRVSHILNDDVNYELRTLVKILASIDARLTISTKEPDEYSDGRLSVAENGSG